MSELTWRKIYDDFKSRHPNLSRMSVRYDPYDYAEILVYLNNGMKLSYNYDSRLVNFAARPHEVRRPTRKAQAVF